MTRRRWLSTLAGVAGAAGMLALAFGTRAEAGDLYKVGDKVDLARYELVDLEGKTRSLSEFKGQVIFLNFFSYG